MKSRFLLFGLAALLVGCSTDSRSDSNQTASPSVVETSSKDVTVDCSLRSQANFGPAFADPSNLVVGPLVLVGGAEETSEAVVLAHDGQKFPLLVKAGHTVTVQLPRSVQDSAGLVYGSLPEGIVKVSDAYDSIRFVACKPEEPSGSRADGPVTFWSGFVMTKVPQCLPLDVSVDGEATLRRVQMALGADCKGIPVAVAPS